MYWITFFEGHNDEYSYKRTTGEATDFNHETFSILSLFDHIVSNTSDAEGHPNCQPL